VITLLKKCCVNSLLRISGVTLPYITRDSKNYFAEIDIYLDLFGGLIYFLDNSILEKWLAVLNYDRKKARIQRMPIFS
jgi:hypothetical protein